MFFSSLVTKFKVCVVSFIMKFRKNWFLKTMQKKVKLNKIGQMRVGLA